MQLFRRDYGTGEPPLVIVHGLFGSGANWATIGRALGERRRVILPDLRNHGRSPHADAMPLADLAADLAELIAAEGLAPVTVAGHSLGGKAAMVLALTRPDLVARLAVLDIAPVAYPERYGPMVDGLARLAPATWTTRDAAEAALAAIIAEPAVRQLMMTNLKRDGNRFAWRIHLDAIRRHLPALMGFELPAGAVPYRGPTLFLAGADSDYVTPDRDAASRRWFPRRDLIRLKGAGHWLHVDQPESFRRTLEAWLD